MAIGVMKVIVLAIFMAMVADAAVHCGTVTSKLAPCLNYLTKGGELPAKCCAGVHSLNSVARTTPDRQQACRCLQSAAHNITGLQPNLAASLPRACRLNVPYPISFNTNCNNIK